MNYKELQNGWEDAAKQSVHVCNSAIHPIGLKGEQEYYDSGFSDMQEIIKLIDKHDTNLFRLSGEKSIIDFGCGNGRVTNHAANYFDKVYAIDFSLQMLKQIPDNQKIIKYWIESPDFADEINEPLGLGTNDIDIDIETHQDEIINCCKIIQADYCFSISVFIHNKHSDGKKILNSLSLLIKPGGYLFLQIPIYTVSKNPDSWTDVGVWTAQMLIEQCNACGLEIVQAHHNLGEFSFNKIGPNHHQLQVLRKL